MVSSLHLREYSQKINLFYTRAVPDLFFSNPAGAGAGFVMTNPAVARFSNLLYY